MALEFKKIEDKWQTRWDRAKIFEANPSDKKKFFINIPYPYMNGFLHIGRLFTYLRGEVLARYKRMKGANVLFPFAFHCTGSPIINASERIKEKEEKQISILQGMGISEDLIPKFSDPIFWTEFFPQKTKEHLQKLGMSIDWRRSFITTSLNPHYDKFIQWQFRKLKEKNYVIKGSHPVIWCCKCQNAVGDHSRLKGEGETPQEFTLLKFKMGDEFIIAATLRPETVFGQTNLWVDPDVEYVRAQVGDERWIVSNPCIQKLSDQEKSVKIIGKVNGRDLIGKKAMAPVIKKEIIVLPSKFCNPDKGTGIVTSVPSDAPDDWMGLYDIKNDKETIKKYGLSPDEINAIEPVAIIVSQGWGNFPAKEICNKMDIKNQDEREKLEIAKKEIYKSGFYTGKMNKNCGKFEGMSVENAKEEVKKMMISSGEADIMYEPSDNVVCRCLTPCTVKIVKDQYFITYGDPKWKALVHNAVDRMEFYPKLIKKQFEYVVDWLNNWACTRKIGLGTRLPWDEEWIIESLSDSTIYMAYYTIAHNITQINPDKIDDSFFDYIFLSKGNAKNIAKKIKMPEEFVESLNKEFNYWYPFDLRTSGKDLIQNHLTFCIFNHVAIFPEKHLPRSFGVNGWLLVDKEKMSSSKGNAFAAYILTEKYGADVVRISLMYSGEGVDDPNWETNFVEIMGDKLLAWHEFATQNYGRGRSDMRYIDLWFESMIINLIREVEEAFEGMMFRTAIQKGYFDMQRTLKWYLKRTDIPNKEIISKFIVVQAKFLAPFCPHLAEEIWETIGKKDFISISPWPTAWKKCDKKMLYAEDYLKKVVEDIREIIKVAKITNLKKIYIYTTPEWKWKIVEIASQEQDFKSSMKRIMQDEKLRKNGKKSSKFLDIVIKNRIFIEKIDEREILTQGQEFIANEIGAPVVIDSEFDAGGKNDLAMPGRAAIYIK
ncbi:MAG: leucine--tRNA ligase [Candidatus Methanofastidiosia archaeon]